MDVTIFKRSVESFAWDIKSVLDSSFAGEAQFDSPRINDEQLRATFQISKTLKVSSSKNSPLLIECMYRLCPNSTGHHLAVEASTFKIQYKLGKKAIPIVRFEYDRQARNKPVSHFHFHGDSVPLGLLLARAGRSDAAVQQHQVHFPMGGHRFRVCLEDIIELLIREFNAEALNGWEEHVHNARGKYRTQQVETVVRKNLSLAISMLQELGYTIETPADFKVEDPEVSDEW